ncbi:3'-5' exonuclease [bacterium]|nr:3'-5' exonuclease [bacterium]
MINPADKIYDYLSRKHNRFGSENELFSLFFNVCQPNNTLRHRILTRLLVNDGRFIFDEHSEGWTAKFFDFKISLNEIEYCAVDLETTGLNKKINRITEVALIKFKKGQIIDKMIYLVNPMCPIPLKLQKLTGITNQMVFDKPAFDYLIPEIKDFIQNSVLVAHHSSFDLRFLNAEFNRFGYESLRNAAVCTCRLARKIFADLNSYSLDSLAKFFELTFVSRHRAYGDALMALEIFNIMLGYLQREYCIETLDELIRFENQ